MENVTVACCGTFDGQIHPGHIRYLNDIKKLGTVLVVFVVPDWVVRRNKQRAPLFSQEERAENVRKLGIANRVIPLSGTTDEDHLKKILQHAPAVFCRSEDQLNPFMDELESQLVAIGAKFVVVPRYRPELYSTTHLHFTS